MTSVLGALVNVDWNEIFRSFYKVLRVQVAVRDPSKIPKDRIVEIEQSLFLIEFDVDEDQGSGGLVENPGDDGLPPPGTGDGPHNIGPDDS